MAHSAGMIPAMADLPANPASRANPRERFSDRVENYARYRPGYPNEILKLLTDRYDLKPQMAIADIGSGTGISS